MTDAAGELIIPFWIVLMAHAAIALGTLSGGWRIVHTMGSKITKLVPMGGFAAETAGAVTIFASTALGIPVSTTHAITGAIVGVGSVRSSARGALGRGRADRLGLAADHPRSSRNGRRAVWIDLIGPAHLYSLKDDGGEWPPQPSPPPSPFQGEGKLSFLVG